MAEVSLWLEDGSKSICDTITATRVGVGIKIDFFILHHKTSQLSVDFQIGDKTSQLSVDFSDRRDPVEDAVHDEGIPRGEPEQKILVMAFSNREPMYT